MCKNCELKPVYEFTNKRKLCKQCFINWFQKKFLYTIRKFSMINKEEVIAYENSGNFRDVVLEDLLKIFSEKSRISLIKLPSKKKFTKKAISETIDSNSIKIMQFITENKISQLKNLSASDKSIIKPLYLFLDSEVLLYAKLKNLKFEKIVEKKTNWSFFIDELEIKHPEIKRAIVNSYLELYK